MPPMSPFSVHRDKVLGHYATATWLRSVVLAMWNGSCNKVGLTSLTNLDSAHYSAFLEMVESYRIHGENDPGFMSLVSEVRARKDEEQRAADRQALLEDWLDAVKEALAREGVRTGVVSDQYDWFESLYNKSTKTSEAAHAYCCRNE